MSQQPVVFQYQRALDEFRRAGEASPLLERMSELISLLDLTTTLNSGLSREEILDAALLIVMGELQAARGCILLRVADGGFEVKAARGLPAGSPGAVRLDGIESDAVVLKGSGAGAEAFAALGLEAVCPIRRREPGATEEAGGPAEAGTSRVVAAIGIGGRADGRSYGPEEAGFLRSVAACAAAPLENGLIHDELRRVNQSLSVKVFQLHGLFDISRELTGSFDEDSITNLVTSTLMGHLMVSRCAIYLPAVGGLACVHERGLRGDVEPRVVSPGEARGVLEALRAAKAVDELPPGALRERLVATRMSLVVPLGLGHRPEGLLAVGERPSGVPFTEEDREFVHTLGRQAMGALEGVRLYRISIEKQRRDREMQIARDIQRSLFPSDWPAIPGFEVAADSRACFEVGGDLYDVIGMDGQRVALAIADVSGKGTPASILMASVHASLRALSGIGLQPLMERLNRFLLESTQPNRYVTLFYGELDPLARRFQYINAGHVPPFWVKADGSVHRLETGGPVVGLLPDIGFEVGEVLLAPGDLVAMVTDGATEALSPAEAELGDAGVAAALVRGHAGTAAESLHALLLAVDEWTGAAGCSDDLTALFLKAL